MLISCLLIVAGAWAFIELADEVREGDPRETDQRILLSMRNPADPADPLGPLWFEEAVRDITALGSMTVLSLLSGAVAGFLAIRRQYHALALLLAALAGGILLNWFLKDIFDRTRPGMVSHLLHVSSASFPSGHSLLAAVVYLTLGALLARLVEELRFKLYILGVALLLTILVGLSRLYLGVHYPTDVLAGWTVGLVWALTCWLAARHLQRRGAVEQAQ